MDLDNSLSSSLRISFSFFLFWTCHHLLNSNNFDILYKFVLILHMICKKIFYRIKRLFLAFPKIWYYFWTGLKEIGWKWLKARKILVGRNFSHFKKFSHFWPTFFLRTFFFVRLKIRPSFLGRLFFTDKVSMTNIDLRDNKGHAKVDVFSKIK